MIDKYSILFLTFMFYAFVGWCIEEVNEVITTKKIVNRGFLIGPYLPIYGFGGLLITLLLDKYKGDYIVLFLLSSFVCSILEYFTSYILEKIFKARWWDYSRFKYNINGRICLYNVLLFGLLGTFMIYFINPLINKILVKLNPIVLNRLSIILLIIFITDIFISAYVIDKVKNKITKIEKDNTEEITHVIKDFLLKNWLTRRLLNAFPTMKYVKNAIKNNISRVLTKEQVKEEKIKIDTEAKISKMKIDYEYKINNMQKKAEKKIKKIHKN